MSIDRPPSPLERLAIARGSSNLKVEERRRGDVDYLIAAGIAARGSRVGGSLMHLHAGGGQVAMRAACDAVRCLVKAMDAKRNWRLNGPSIERVTELALLHHIAPACPKCSGRAYLEVPGTNRLSATQCPSCRGSGSRPIGKRHGDEVAAVLVELSMIESVVERTVGRLVR